jgi:DNA (cytosine-5)-methyltransferase 1
MSLTHLDLFSGIGGFALAANRQGFKTTAFCEIEKFPRKVLKKHWPNTVIYKDIKELNGTKHKGCTVVTGGFPCQPFSCANASLRKGTKDNRYLWPEMLRVIHEAQPDWVIGENVIGIINLALDEVCRSLENINFTVQPFIIPACAVDSPQRRERVWIVARNLANSNGIVSERCAKNPLQRKCKMQGEFGGNGTRKPRFWPTDTGICRVFNGVSAGLDRGPRIKSLGNAIVPQVVEPIFNAIKSYYL